MLIPRKVKHRKQHHPRQRGIASGEEAPSAEPGDVVESAAVTQPAATEGTTPESES